MLQNRECRLLWKKREKALESGKGCGSLRQVAKTEPGDFGLFAPIVNQIEYIVAF